MQRNWFLITHCARRGRPIERAERCANLLSSDVGLYDGLHAGNYAPVLFVRVFDGAIRHTYHNYGHHRKPQQISEPVCKHQIYVVHRDPTYRFLFEKSFFIVVADNRTRVCLCACVCAVNRLKHLTRRAPICLCVSDGNRNGKDSLCVW